MISLRIPEPLPKKLIFVSIEGNEFVEICFQELFINYMYYSNRVMQNDHFLNPFLTLGAAIVSNIHTFSWLRSFRYYMAEILPRQR